MNSMPPSVRRVLWVVLFASASSVAGFAMPRASQEPGPAREAELARRILADRTLTEVLRRAKAVIETGYNAGEGYGEVWIRDLATFVSLACEVGDPSEVREKLLMFFRFQGEDGNIVDGYIPAKKANVGYDYIRKDDIADHVAHKNTVETDQESSLVQAVYKYVEKTGDREFLRTHVGGQTVLERMDRALRYLLDHRFSAEYGLLWGATTVDWGDVQPEHEWGVVLDESSHRAIDIYDNAMFLVAIADLVSLLGHDAAAIRRWEAVGAEVRKNVREHLWDDRRGKFRPHVYLDGSPFPADFDEEAMWYHGGTAVAIEADLLSPEEVAATLSRMVENVRRARAPSIGLTVYPPYPGGFFKNPSMARPYSYQNGGDWTWFGARMIQQLVRKGLVEEAYREIRPMVDRVLRNDGFYEWYTRDGKPSGSGTFRGSAGVLGRAVQMLRAWAQVRARGS